MTPNHLAPYDAKIPGMSGVMQCKLRSEISLRDNIQSSV